MLNELIGRRKFIKLSAIIAAASILPSGFFEDLTGSATGWAPPDIGIKDHTIFDYNGAHYLAGIYLGKLDSHWEDRFVYAQSTDYQNWTYLGPILIERHTGWWDGYRIWAPHVVYVDGLYHMTYTGVRDPQICQSILHATSTDPSDLNSWNVDLNFVFQPNHKGMVWAGPGYWSDCRDPMVLVGKPNLLYYTGRDVTGGIVGVATADTISGPWTDQGAILTLPNAMPESPTVLFHEGKYFLCYNDTQKKGEQIRWSDSPTGAWSDPIPFPPGWADELFYDGNSGTVMASYLTDYTVTVNPVSWSPQGMPYIGNAPYLTYLPKILN